MKAQFEHDCENCVLISTTSKVDIYVCPDEENPNLVVRHGNDGPDYYSDISGFANIIEEYIDKTPVHKGVKS